MKKIDNKNTPQVSGIDALYYFAQSGGGYDNYFEDIINQIEGKKQEFSSFSIAYADTDIIITLNDINIKYSGMGRDGFLWFNHEFFRIGFKDSEKAQNIQNIRVQLNAIGIYTIGIESLLEYVNEQFLKGALLSERNFLITRIDVNMFIQHDFKYLRKEMILSKKKNHSANIGERSSGYELETYYVGKNPFMLRIYNKLKELESASQIKRELMYNYFGVNGLDVEKPIFNVEFELHREFLKRYGIESVKDALGRAKSLFELGCDLIKLLDISTLTDAQINSSNRKRADTLPIWQYISTHYDNKSFMQLSTPLEKIEKISYRYTLEDARKPIKRHINRLLLHDNNPTSLYFIELLQDAKEEFDAKLEMKKVHDEEKTKENNKPTFADELKTYSDYGIQELERRISKEMRGVMPDDALYDEYVYKYSAIHDELVKRGLVEFPF